MNLGAFFEALQVRLEAMSGSTAKVYANQSADGVTPRYEVSAGPHAMTTIGVDGSTNMNALAQITAIVADGTYSAEVNALVQDVVDEFPVGTALDGAIITVMPEPSSPIIEGGEYRVPITLRYRAIS